ncbi:MAG: DUF4280 domain-containing protein [Lachnospiraceae bacterium]|nr:DUF4280 domain-containing protein [Lachnospiraceae bacterium]
MLGVELKCPWGTSHSYLYVGSDNIDINNLPQAHVEDCIAYYNITPFGKCIYRIGQPCELCFCLADRWKNSEPQNVIVNGREIITTGPIARCTKFDINRRLTIWKIGMKYLLVKFRKSFIKCS